MALTLHRTHSLNLALKKPGSLRAFAFDLELGVGKRVELTVDPVDPESGMLLNLVRVDELLRDLSSELQRISFASIMKVIEHSISFLNQELLRDDGVILTRLLMKEKRGEFFGWDGEYFCGRSQTLEISGRVYLFEATYRAPERKSALTALFEEIPSLREDALSAVTSNAGVATSDENSVDAAVTALAKEVFSTSQNFSPYLSELKIKSFGHGFEKVFQR